MDLLALTDEQREVLFEAVDRHRRYFERLHQRCVDAGFGREDFIREMARECLLALRAFVLALNGTRRKGAAHAFYKRARHWPKV